MNRQVLYDGHQRPGLWHRKAESTPTPQKRGFLSRGRSKLHPAILAVMFVATILGIAAGYFCIPMYSKLARLKQQNSKLRTACPQAADFLVAATPSFTAAHPPDLDEPASVDPSNHEKSFLDQFPVCDWVKDDHYKYPYHTENPGFEGTVRRLNEEGITYMLSEGSLVGAYRHGGPLPCDGDHDIIFPVWLNGLAACDDVTGSATPVLRGNPAEEEKLTLCDKTRAEYVVEVHAWLQQRFPWLHDSIQEMTWGGLRVVLDGTVGVDLIVSILDQAYLHHGPICRCPYGKTQALVIEGADEFLKDRYGVNALTPDAKVKECLERHESMEWQTIGELDRTRADEWQTKRAYMLRPRSRGRDASHTYQRQVDETAHLGSNPPLIPHGRRGGRRSGISLNIQPFGGKGGKGGPWSSDGDKLAPNNRGSENEMHNQMYM